MTGLRVVHSSLRIDPPALGGEIERLNDYASRHGISLEWALGLAAAVARNLARLHAQRRAHGAVHDRNIMICDGEGWLSPPDIRHSGAAEGDDVRQFRKLFAGVFRSITDPAKPAVLSEFEALVAAQPEDEGAKTAGSRMNRIAQGLQGLAARLPQLAAPPDAGRKVVLLVRAVPDLEPPPPSMAKRRRLRGMSFLYVLLLSGAALGVAAAAFLIRAGVK